MEVNQISVGTEVQKASKQHSPKSSTKDVTSYSFSISICSVTTAAHHDNSRINSNNK